MQESLAARSVVQSQFVINAKKDEMIGGSVKNAVA